MVIPCRSFAFGCGTGEVYNTVQRGRKNRMKIGRREKETTTETTRRRRGEVGRREAIAAAAPRLKVQVTQHRQWQPVSASAAALTTIIHAAQKGKETSEKQAAVLGR